jgi:hypothetical protein
MIEVSAPVSPALALPGAALAAVPAATSGDMAQAADFSAFLADATMASEAASPSLAGPLLPIETSLPTAPAMAVATPTGKTGTVGKQTGKILPDGNVPRDPELAADKPSTHEHEAARAEKPASLPAQDTLALLPQAPQPASPPETSLQPAAPVPQTASAPEAVAVAPAPVEPTRPSALPAAPARPQGHAPARIVTPAHSAPVPEIPRPRQAASSAPSLEASAPQTATEAATPQAPQAPSQAGSRAPLPTRAKPSRTQEPSQAPAPLADGRVEPQARSTVQVTLPVASAPVRTDTVVNAPRPLNAEPVAPRFTFTVVPDTSDATPLPQPAIALPNVSASALAIKPAAETAQQPAPAMTPAATVLTAKMPTLPTNSRPAALPAEQPAPAPASPSTPPAAQEAKVMAVTAAPIAASPPADLVTAQMPTLLTSSRPAALPAEQPAPAPAGLATAPVALEAKVVVPSAAPIAAPVLANLVTPAPARPTEQKTAPIAAFEIVQAAVGPDLTPAPIQVDLRGTPTPAVAAPTFDASTPSTTQDIAALVDRISEARAAAAPHTVRAALVHEDFGAVSLNFRTEQSQIHVTLDSADPGFAPAVHAAAAASLADNTDDSARREGQPPLPQTQDQPAPQNSASASQQQPRERAAAGEQGGARHNAFRQPSGAAERNPTPAAPQQRRSGLYA